MTETLIVYYSLSGNTKFIAEEIHKAINADILELKPIKELNPNSGMKYFWGGFQANMKTKPKLEPIDIDPLKYDLIILGTPVWSWTFSPPLRSFLSMFDMSGKKLALWVCSAGNGIKAMEKFKKDLADSDITGEIIFKDPQERSDAEMANRSKRAQEWAKKLVGIA